MVYAYHGLGAFRARRIARRTGHNSPAAAPKPQACNPRTPVVYSDIPDNANEWAEKVLNFQPSPKQKEVLESNSKRLMLCCPRQWGKSTVVSIKTLHAALKNPNTVTVVLASTETQAGMLVEKVMDLAAHLGYNSWHIPGRKHSILFANGSRVFAVPHRAPSVRGVTTDYLIIDEAAIVSRQVLSAILPSLARTNGSIWLLSTPNGQEGFFYDLWITPNHWTKIKATIEDTPYATPEFIADLRAMMTDRDFRQEFHCEFHPPEDAVFTAEMIDKMFRDFPEHDNWTFPPLNPR